MLTKVRSGCQTGADVSGLVTAKMFGLETGGQMPKGFLTTAGPKPEWAKKYNLQESSSSKYPPRTFANVKDSDGTIRFAFNFNSPGEKLTLKAIEQYGKPHIDVDLNNPRPVEEVTEWIKDNNINDLNVAGNSEKTNPQTYNKTTNYLTLVFKGLGLEQLPE